MAAKFPLATVKRVRELREKQEQREFARRRRAVQTVQIQIAEAERLKLGAVDELNRKRKKEFEPRTDLLYVRYISSLDIQKRRLNKDLARVSESLEEQRLVMMEARKKRRMMEILNDHFDESQRMDELRSESLRLSEVAIIRYGRNKLGG
jgi:flagellar export protein FliJ